MQKFDYKDIYLDEGKKVLEINILPEKYCNFDCIFCPIGRSKNKIDTKITFDNITNPLNELGEIIQKTSPDIIFINSKGEALIHDHLYKIITFIKNKNVSVRLLSNGYLVNKKEYIEIANICDEVIGELKVTNEIDFQKIQRPLKGYTLSEYISNMVHFNKQYEGKFIFEITILKGYSDDEKSIQKLKKIIQDISPDKLIVVRLQEEKFQKKLGISNEHFEEIVNILQACM